ncbi:MAG: hypothetical protein J6I72_06555 [Muribaculaceae bacterium]|nr:hypothetical protein [Muribaculaceae bacterium]
MKKIYTLMLALLCYSGMAMAQDSDYLPLLREGVKWVYAESYTDYAEDATMQDMNTETRNRLYTIEVKGDTIIDGIGYKKVYRHSADLWNSDWFYDVPDCSGIQPVACLREEGRTVYARTLNDPTHEIGEWFNQLKSETSQGHEVILYDFQESEEGLFKRYGTVQIGAETKDTYYSAEIGVVIAEGLGVIEPGGELVMIDYVECRTGYPNDFVRLHHVEDADGNIIYKGEAYTEPARGDLNGDGRVDVEDVNALINIILKVE